MKVWPRWLARGLAFLGGYFWMPCPNCGQMFAGFEWSGGIKWTGSQSGKMTCADCPLPGSLSPGWKENPRG